MIKHDSKLVNGLFWFNNDFEIESKHHRKTVVFLSMFFEISFFFYFKPRIMQVVSIVSGVFHQEGNRAKIKLNKILTASNTRSTFFIPKEYSQCHNDITKHMDKAVSWL